jgi:hypothetical protein
MLRFSLLMFLLLIACTGFAQWQIAASIQPGKMFIIDKDFSSAPFSAVLPGGALSVAHVSDHSMHTLSFSYLGGSLKTSTQPQYSLSQNYFNADYSWLYKLGSPGAAWAGGAGAAFNVLYDNRTYAGIINNNTTFDFAASLGLAGSLSYSFNNSLHGWSLSDQVSIPFVSWLIQPPYGNENSADAVTRSGDRKKIAGFSSFLRLKNTLSLDKQLSSRGMLSLAYSWDYYKIKDLREVRQAAHRIGLIYRLTL